MLQRLGLTWPSSYAVLDTETTGLDPHRDLAYEIGFVTVVRGEVKKRVRFLLNWTRCPWVSKRWLTDRVVYSTRGMQNGQHLVRPILQLIAQGRNPEPVLREIHSYLTRMQQDRIPLLGHNILFDLAMLGQNFEQYELGQVFLEQLLLFDTGLIEKGRQLYPQASALPAAGETCFEFLRRLQKARAKVKWGLEHCADKVYDLVSLGVELGQLHRADYDAWVTHLLFQRMQRLCLVRSLPAKRYRKQRVA